MAPTPISNVKTAASPGSGVVDSPVTKGAIKSMLYWNYSTQACNNNNSSNRCSSTTTSVGATTMATAAAVQNNGRPVVILQLLHIKKYKKKNDDDDTQTYEFRLSDNEFTILAIAQEDTFHNANNNWYADIKQIQDIPISNGRTYICINDYQTVYNSNNNTHYIRIQSFNIHYRVQITSRIMNVNDCQRNDIAVLRWIAQMKGTKNNNSENTRFLFENKNLQYAETCLVVDALLLRNTDTNLCEFKYKGNQMGDTGFEYLVTALQYNTTLQHLDVSRNHITYPSMLRKFNRTLTSLSLRGNNLSDDGACVIATSLLGNTTLKELDLSRNQIGNIGIAALANILKYNQGLVTLLIDNNIYDNNLYDNDEGMLPIYDALEYNTTLQYLKYGQKRSVQSGRYLTWAYRQAILDAKKEKFDTIIQRIIDSNDTIQQMYNVDIVNSKHAITKLYGFYADNANESDDDNDDIYHHARIRVAPKKGQRQRHDILNWLRNKQHILSWSGGNIHLRNEMNEVHEQQKEVRSTKRLLVSSPESMMSVTSNKKKIRL